jgi:hypothetical protein
MRGKNKNLCHFPIRRRPVGGSLACSALKSDGERR